MTEGIEGQWGHLNWYRAYEVLKGASDGWQVEVGPFTLVLFKEKDEGYGEWTCKAYEGFPANLYYVASGTTPDKALVNLLLPMVGAMARRAPLEGEQA